MSWFRRGQTAKDGPGSAIDLRDLAGLNGQLLFALGLRGHQMTRIPCTVLKVDRSEILLEPTGGSNRPGADSAVILEVLHQSALIQCFTTVIRAEKSGPLALRVPARPHVVQRRRNPRVDIYHGITLHTPDRPIEEVAAQMINLSLDGAACVMTEPVAPGTPLVLNLASIGVHPPTASAIVARCVPTPTHLWVVGLRFDGLAPEQEAFLSGYIADFTQSLTEQEETVER
ncbi:MAG: flagellar brake protein [Bacillota bacterium]